MCAKNNDNAFDKKINTLSDFQTSLVCQVEDKCKSQAFQVFHIHTKIKCISNDCSVQISVELFKMTLVWVFPYQAS